MKWYAVELNGKYDYAVHGYDFEDAQKNFAEEVFYIHKNSWDLRYIEDMNGYFYCDSIVWDENLGFVSGDLAATDDEIRDGFYEFAYDDYTYLELIDREGYLDKNNRWQPNIKAERKKRLN